MADQQFTQEGKRLKIRTVLDDLPAERSLREQNGDPLLLVWVKGRESLSAPYEYRVRMWRHRDKPRLAPADLINTPVTIRFKISRVVLQGDHLQAQGREFSTKQVREDLAYVRRCGVFETFKDEGFMHNDEDLIDKDFRQYSATIVPAFRMLNRETAFRIFEHKDAKEIIEEVARFFPNLRITTDLIKEQLPKMDYCVQFGETSFNFLSRLMAQFGIWYFFDHHADPAGFPKMVLGTGRPDFEACKVSDDDKTVPVSQMQLTIRPPNGSTIVDFNRVFNPTSRFARFGNFNPLTPTDPLIGDGAQILAQTDLIEPEKSEAKGSRTLPGVDDRFRTEAFPVLAATKGEAQKFSERWLHSREPSVAMVTGTSKNPALMPGFKFEVVRQATAKREAEAAAGRPDVVVFENSARDDPPPTIQKQGSFLVTHVEIEGTELAHHHAPGFVKEFVKLILPHSSTGLDVLGHMTEHGLAAYLEEKVKHDLEHSPTHNPEKAPAFWPVFAGGIVGGTAAALLPALGEALERALDEEKNHPNRFSCSFTAIPLDGRDSAGLRSLPTPTDWIKPTASGPHLATVIGPEGADTENTGQIPFADAFGRVRIRFPWDRGPIKKAGDPPFEPFKKFENTCWVRVVEGWAGRQFGSQYLPRIGQEVLVSFIGGDPDQPIVSGRVYNADRGFANIPFAEGQAEFKMIKQEDLSNAVGSNNYRFTGLKTSSFPKGKTDKERYHLLRYDDTYNCEQWLMRSQGRLDVTAFAHSFETTYGNKQVRVVPGKDKDGKEFGGSEFTTVGGEYDLHIGDARYEGVDKAYNLTVKTDTIFDLQAAHHTRVKAESTLNAQSIVIEAPIKITLKVGSSFVVIDPAGVWINGPLVMINSGGTPGITMPVVVTDPIDAQAAEPGDQWNKRLTTCDPQPQGGGGPRRTHVAGAPHGLAVTANPDGSLQVGAGIRVAGGNPAYQDAVINDLARMDQTPSGHALIDRLNNSGHTTTIQQRPPGSTVADTGAAYANDVGSRRPGTPGTTDAAGNPLPGAGTGSDTTISYNPSDFPIPGTRTQAPSDVALFHEMTHADHAAQGTRDRTPRADGFRNQEEFNTIQDENRYRNERGPWPGMPADNQRHDHSLRGV